MSTVVDANVLQVTSADGTEISVFVSGTGRPLVAVHGTTSDHNAWRFVRPLLEPHLTLYAMDRRGRGRSGDAEPYSLDAEYADVAAVVDAAAAAYGSPVDLLGHSYGGNVAFGAVQRTANVRRLVLYEGWPPPNVEHRTYSPQALARLDNLLAQGRREEMMAAFFREVVLVTEEELSEVKAAPTWPLRLAAAHTVPREMRAFGAQAFDPAQAAAIDVPVLLVVGSDSPAEIRADPEVVAAALPDARIVTLDGQAHMAHLTAPDLLAKAVLDFLHD